MNGTFPSRKVQRLIMVYDAPSGFLSAVTDSAKKLFGKGCDLCAITHGLTGKRSEWEDFEKEFQSEIVLLHKDELEDIERQLNRKVEPPSVLVELEDGSIEILLRRITIKNLEKMNVERLISSMKMWAESLNIVLE